MFPYLTNLSLSLVQGWRWSYIITGIMGVVATLLLLLIVREPARGAQSDPSDKKIEEEKETNFSRVDGERASQDSNVGVSSEVLVNGAPARIFDVVKSLIKPPVLCLAFAACLRHTGEFCLP